MNKDIVAGHWSEIKGAVRQQWAKFTDNDMQAMKGNYEELLGILQKKYGYAKEKASQELDTFLKQMEKRNWH